MMAPAANTTATMATIRSFWFFTASSESYDDTSDAICYGSVPKMTPAGEHHRNAKAVGGGDHIRILLASAGLHDS